MALPLMMINYSLLLTLALPPIAGGIIGYFTNDLAIKMLFRPYKPFFLGPYRLPFTPGLIPRNQERLAKRVSDTIMGSLLTPEELQRLARKLLQRERVEGALGWLLQLALKQIREDKQQKTAQILANILQDLFSESLPRLLKALARQDNFLSDQINRIFDQILLEFRLSELQSRQFADWLLGTVLPPDTIRLALVDFLSDRNIQVIDEGFREKTSGTYWVVANLFGVRNSLTRLRAFCLEEKETANLRLKELLLSLEIRNRLKDWLQQLSLENLPVSTVRQLRRTTGEVVRTYIRERGEPFLKDFGKSVDWDNVAVLIVNRLQSSTAVTGSLGLVSEELASILERYLEDDLEKIVKQIIPILAIDQVIINRINETPAAELETAVQAIVRSELQAIVNLGGVLGLIIGALQSGFFFVSRGF
ncbi:DUF445 domain-containing protein [Synechocystis sp. PCC 7339]|uniref:DUF445 domain-containing protein n=1 Tax=unclassified Synechocystis TaxID=2640012 RepID=UPI001BAEC18B|nr:MULTISPECIES: DUF445 domain-containing protein [unclassified Synechocystis]QUS62346.1 DUF445 domain-containing protein [Synechocystis sp. PCC 7338]UAJ74476.1 DUF445 domain-containing protein [Synechocystis sp. PCC 7339]